MQEPDALKMDAPGQEGPTTMITGQIVMGLAGAFLLGIVFSSGLKILVRYGR
jgi:hypothetical protein